jgi:DNA polymerase-3 subunit epsilon
MKRVLIVDLETNGVDATNDDIVEMGGVLYSISNETTLASFSWLVKAPHNDAFPINGIPFEAIEEHGINPEDANKRLDAWLQRGDVIVAHNALFERGFIEPRCATATTKPWVCTQDDVDWPRKSPDQKLTSIMLAHGLGVSHAHRALTDCEMIARLFDRSAELMMPTRTLLERAMRPKALFAMVSPRFDADKNAQAKAAGFRWDAIVPKRWARRIALEDVDTLDLPFEIERV